jgi:hypothetical protein
MEALFTACMHQKTRTKRRRKEKGHDRKDKDHHPLEDVEY